MKRRNGLYVGGGTSTSIIKVVADGVKTYQQILDSMYSAISGFDLLQASRLVLRHSKTYLNIENYDTTNGTIRFDRTMINVTGDKIYHTSFQITNNNGGKVITRTTTFSGTSVSSDTITINASGVVSAGTEFEILML